MEVASPSISLSESVMGSLQGRSLCIQTEQPTETIFQLEIGYVGLSHGCLPAGMIKRPALRLSPIHVDSQGSRSSSKAGGRASNSDSFVGGPTLVSNNVANVTRLPVEITMGDSSVAGSDRTGSSSDA